MEFFQAFNTEQIIYGIFLLVDEISKKNCL